MEKVVLEYTIRFQQGEKSIITLITRNASDEFANAIQSLAKIDNAIVQLQDEARKLKLTL